MNTAPGIWIETFYFKSAKMFCRIGPKIQTVLQSIFMTPKKVDKTAVPFYGRKTFDADGPSGRRAVEPSGRLLNHKINHLSQVFLPFFSHTLTIFKVSLCAEQRMLQQGTLTEGESSVRLTSSLR